MEREESRRLLLTYTVLQATQDQTNRQLNRRHTTHLVHKPHRPNTRNRIHTLHRVSMGRLALILDKRFHTKNTRTAKAYSHLFLTGQKRTNSKYVTKIKLVLPLRYVVLSY